VKSRARPPFRSPGPRLQYRRPRCPRLDRIVRPQLRQILARRHRSPKPAGPASTGGTRGGITKEDCAISFSSVAAPSGAARDLGHSAPALQTVSRRLRDAGGRWRRDGRGVQPGARRAGSSPPPAQGYFSSRSRRGGARGRPMVRVAARPRRSGHRAAGAEQVGHALDALSARHAAARIGVHPRVAHLVAAAFEIGWPILALVPASKGASGRCEALQLASDDLLCRCRHGVAGRCSMRQSSLPRRLSRRRRARASA